MNTADAADRRHRLEPHRLPDAGGGSEHDSRWIERLFPARFAAAVNRTIHSHNQFLRAAIRQIRRDIVTEKDRKPPV